MMDSSWGNFAWMPTNGHLKVWAVLRADFGYSTMRDTSIAGYFCIIITFVECSKHIVNLSLRNHLRHIQDSERSE
jgi:hypothetical protein